MKPKTINLAKTEDFMNY